MRYITVAFRIHTRYRWFTLINIIGLALGIVCSAILLLYVDFHFSTDTHHSDNDKIYRLVLDIHTPSGAIEHEGGAALAMGDAFRTGYSQVEKTAFCMKFYSAPTITIQSSGKRTQFKEANIVAYADNNFIELFENNFIAGDKRTALIAPRTVVLSETQAVKYFGTIDVIGESLNINNKTDLVITGVLADSRLNSDLNFDVLVSLPTLKILNPNYEDQNFSWIGSNNWLFVKLKDGIDVKDLNAQLPSFVAKYLGTNFNHWRFHFQPLSEMHFDRRYGGVVNKSILWVLAGVAVALISVVCSNYVNLSIAQSQSRAKEIGIRKCLGSSRPQLFFQLMTETTILVFLSVCIAFVGSYQVLPFINTWMQVDLSLVQLAQPEMIGWFILFVIGLIFSAGYYPAVFLSGFDPAKAMSGKITKIGGAHKGMQQSLIAFQYTIALLFLISTLIIVTQMEYMLNNDVGFSKERIITINVPKSNFTKLQTFRNEIENSPGVERASLHHQAPMSATSDGGFIKYDNRAQFEDFIVRDRWADDQFMSTYSLELIAGRNIILQDSLIEVVINETLLRKLNLTDPDAVLGKTMLFDNAGVTGTVVGVVNDFHHRSFQNGIEALAIYPFPNVFNQVGVRFATNTNDQALAGIEKIWKRNFPDDVLDFSFLDQSISGMYHVEQITGKMMKIFAWVSVLICCMGIFGLSVFSTLQRTKEIGIRKVLGASVSNIIYMLSRQYLALLTAAFIIAIPATYILMSQWLNTFAYHISLHWLVFVFPGLLMVAITLLLVGGQSFMTAIANPTKSLKHD